MKRIDKNKEYWYSDRTPATILSISDNSENFDDYVVSQDAYGNIYRHNQYGVNGDTNRCLIEPISFDLTSISSFVIAVPKSFKEEYYNQLHTGELNSSLDIDISDEEMDSLKALSKQMGTDFNMMVTFALMRMYVYQDVEQNPSFSYGILSHEIEFFSEDRFVEMIAKHQTILVYDEKLERKGVIVSAALYNAIGYSGLGES